GDRADIDASRRPEREHPQLEQRGALQHDRARRLSVLARERGREVARARRVLDLRGVGPGLAAVDGPRELRAPVAVPERGPERAGARIPRHEVAPCPGVHAELRAPAPVRLRGDEGPLAGPEENSMLHSMAPDHPPLSACMMYTVDPGPTRSESLCRS